MATLDFWFDYSCPYAYLASTQVEALAARTRAELRWRPMLLGGVFQANGTPQNLSETLSPQKAKHNAEDMMRWARRFEVPLQMPAGHPRRTVEALRATLACGIDPKVVHGFYRAYWAEGREPSAPETVRDVVTRAGHDAERTMQRLGDFKDDLRARTEAAVKAGVFGAPTFVVGEKELFWGQDRMDFVERALGGTPPDRPKRAAPSKPHTLEVYFDFSSPFSYLGTTQAEALARRTGASLVWRPMLLGALFKAIGTADAPILTWSESKRAHTMKDMARWAAHWGAPFRFPSRFPMGTVNALRVWLALDDDAKRSAFREACYRAYWAEDRDISDKGTLAELLAAVGADAEAVLARTQSPEIKQALFAATDRAVQAGVFGAPSFVVDGAELFWGQDRLPLVEDALLA